MNVKIDTAIWKDPDKLRKTLHNAGIIKLIIGNILLIGVLFGQGQVLTVICGIFLGSLGGIEMWSWSKYKEEMNDGN